MNVLSIDFQFDFSREGGKFYKPRPSVEFLHERLLPYLRCNNKKISEIISDYRLPRPSETKDYCVPGTNGYQSEIPDDLVHGKRWVKAMNSPAWTRPNAGIPSETAQLPYCDPIAFGEWLIAQIGLPYAGNPVFLIGLTLDCCVLATAQELYYRGYPVLYLYEAVDTYNGTSEEKDFLLKSPLKMWGKQITMSELIEQGF